MLSDHKPNNYDCSCGWVSMDCWIASIKIELTKNKVKVC
jgi:hypothetical protein